MTNGEKLGYDSAKLKKHFEEFVQLWPDKYEIDCNGCISDYDSLRETYANYNYKNFVNWMNSQFKEFQYMDLLPGGIIVLDKSNDDITKVKVLRIFSSGWAFHLVLLKKKGYDISKPWTIVSAEDYACRNCLKTSWTEEDKAELVKDIDSKLLELDLSNKWHIGDKELYHYTVYCKPEEWPFYRTFAKVLRTLKVKIQSNDFKWDEDLIKEMM